MGENLRTLTFWNCSVPYASRCTEKRRGTGHDVAEVTLETYQVTEVVFFL